MDITWHGNNCYRIKGKKANIILNPDKETGKLAGDIVISCLGEDTAAVEGAYMVFDWPGEYEAKEISIQGFSVATKDEQETVIFCFSIDDVKFCHLCKLGETLSSDMVNKIGDVDVLILDASAESSLSPKKALENIEDIEPKAVLVGVDGEVTPIIKELGAANVEAVEKFSLKASSDLPADKRTFIALKKV